MPELQASSRTQRRPPGQQAAASPWLSGSAPPDTQTPLGAQGAAHSTRFRNGSRTAGHRLGPEVNLGSAWALRCPEAPGPPGG